MDRTERAERIADLPVRGEDDRKADYIVGQLLSPRLDIGAIERAADDLIFRYDR
jgi:hypothetical protein